MVYNVFSMSVLEIECVATFLLYTALHSVWIVGTTENPPNVFCMVEYIVMGDINKRRMGRSRWDDSIEGDGCFLESVGKPI